MFGGRVVHERIGVTERYRGVEGITRYDALDAAGRPVAGPLVAVVAFTHGNEIVGGAALKRLAEQIGRLRRGSVLAVVNNLRAMEANIRHTADGRDMNRLWDAACLARLAAAAPASLCYEERRVLEVAPVIQEAEVILDLHSTSRPSPPHLVFRDDLRHAELATRLGVKLMVTGLHEGAILGGGLCPDVGLRPGERGDRLGFTLEAGQHTAPANVEHAWGVVTRMLHGLGMWDGEVAPVPPEFEVYEVIERFRQAPADTAPYRFVTSDDPVAPGRRGPQRQLKSFEPVEADEVLLVRDTGEVVRAEAPFTMLMPAPTAAPGDDLFYVCQRRHASLQTRPQTDGDARAEATAIERFLDLLADDQAQRGETTVSFDARRTLDLCAELVTRVTRLPPGHPHRRLIVVGRGDDEVDEAEARRSKRYHQAMGRALSSGVQVERIQLLRGAAFGWLRRIAEVAEGAGDSLGLRVSARHPHTVSLLIAGDVDRAFLEGDFHQVAVAVVVEAGTVDAEGEGVAVRVQRAGVFGARPELVRVASSLVASLRADHAQVMAAASPALRALMRGDGSLAVRSPAEAAALRDGLVALQLDTWREALRHVVTQGRPIGGPAAVGPWLAWVMSATGVRDAAELRRLLLREEGGVVHVRADALDGVDAPSLLGAPSEARRVVPPQVLEAADVTRDNLERWMGWKRFVREVQRAPGLLGRDFGLALSGPTLRTRLARWFDDARQLAAREPGQWMVVVVGDGLSPGAEAGEDGRALLTAHRRLLLDGNVRYLRVQHVPGTHFGWLKDLLDTLDRRPSGGEPFALRWETEHGGTVSVVMLARRGEGVENDRNLSAWQIERCAVSVHDPAQRSAHDDRIALWTEPDEASQVHHELLHFGRAYCEGLLRTPSWRITSRPGPQARMALDAAVADVLARWVLHARDHLADATDLQEDDAVAVVAGQLGLVDVELARRLVRAARGSRGAAQAARALWADTPAWSGEGDATVQ